MIELSIGLVISLIMALSSASLSKAAEARAEFWLYCIFLNTYVFSALISLILSAYLMSNLGLGKQTKQLIIVRHVATILTYLLCNSFMYVCIFNYQIDSDESL